MWEFMLKRLACTPNIASTTVSGGEVGIWAAVVDLKARHGNSLPRVDPLLSMRETMGYVAGDDRRGEESE